MIEVLYGMQGIRYRVINEQNGNILYFTDCETAMHYDMHGKVSLKKDEEDFPDVHYEIMERPSDLKLISRMFLQCEPRFCNGRHVLWEYNCADDKTAWLVTNMSYFVYAVFVLCEEAMKYIHDHEGVNGR